jgi:hypothetical protein
VHLGGNRATLVGMSDRKCHKDDQRVPFLCSCDDCCRRAAAAWNGYMDRVFAGEISLADANTLMDGER